MIRPQQKVAFDAESFLSNAGVGRAVINLRDKQTIFSQGDPAASVFYIQKGRVKLTVISKRGKEATIALLGTGDFVGEGCIAASEHLRLATATAITDCTVLKIDRKHMLRMLHQEHELSDQLFNSSEKRLARTLLLLAQFGKNGKPETVIPKISQETLAEMVGTTRSRVSFFLNRFRKLGFIDYNGKMEVHSSLLNVVLHD